MDNKPTDDEDFEAKWAALPSDLWAKAARVKAAGACDNQRKAIKKALQKCDNDALFRLVEEFRRMPERSRCNLELNPYEAMVFHEQERSRYRLELCRNGDRIGTHYFAAQYETGPSVDVLDVNTARMIAARMMFDVGEATRG